jgi:hypothetical protein
MSASSVVPGGKAPAVELVAHAIVVVNGRDPGNLRASESFYKVVEFQGGRD